MKTFIKLIVIVVCLAGMIAVTIAAFDKSLFLGGVALIFFGGMIGLMSVETKPTSDVEPPTK